MQAQYRTSAGAGRTNVGIKREDVRPLVAFGGKEKLSESTADKKSCLQTSTGPMLDYTDPST